MSVRILVTLHLPMEMGAAGRIMAAVAREYPDATVAEPAGGVMSIQADDDRQTPAARRLALRALVKDFLEEFPTVGFDDPDDAGPDEVEGTDLLERLLARHRLEIVETDELAKAVPA